MLKVILILLIVALALALYRALSGNSMRWEARQRLAPLLCRLRGHRRSGRQVRKDGDNYLSRCSCCTLPLRKVGREGNWVVDYVGADAEIPPPEKLARVDAAPPPIASQNRTLVDGR